MLQKYLKTYTLHTTHNMKDYNYEIGIICSKIFLDMGGTFRQNHNKVHGEIEWEAIPIGMPSKVLRQRRRVGASQLHILGGDTHESRVVSFQDLHS